MKIKFECRQLFLQNSSIQKLWQWWQYNQWKWLRGAWRAPTQPTEPIWRISIRVIEQHLGICDTYHLQRKPLSNHTCAVFPPRLSLPSSPPELRESLLFTREILWVGCSFPCLLKETQPIKAAPRFIVFLWWGLLFILECLLAHFPIFRSLNAFSSLALNPFQDYLQSLAGL